MSAPSIACLRIVLQEVEPPVLRSLEVPLSIRLDQLHLVIQAAMGWSNGHLYEIIAGDLSWGFVDPDNDASRLDARNARLSDVLGYGQALTYLYDFGDGWEHTITVESISNPTPGVLYPRLVEVEGPCPPEDVGGPGGYVRFRRAILDPSHELHAQYKAWIAGDFDPNTVDSQPLKDHVRALAKHWSL